jgi:hypothetical protein
MSKDKGNADRNTSADYAALKQQESPLSTQEILAQGEEASKLLDSPVYNLAHRSVIQSIQDEWLSTSPHETQKREGLYQRAQALSMVANEMAMMIVKAQGINDDELAKARKIQREYDENQGF